MFGIYHIRKISFILLLLFVGSCHSLLAQVEDDFADGEFTSNPEWTGDTEKFLINEDFQLQLTDTDAGQSSLKTTFTETSLNNKEWRFWVKQSFSGSDNNQGRIYLSSNTGIINYSGTTSSGAEGYFILLGEGGSEDAIKLYRDDALGESTSLIAEGSPGVVSSSFEIGIRVLRDASGTWDIFVDENGGTDYVFEASGNDATYITSSNLGYSCKYTSSNADNFFLDDVYFGSIEVDEEPPTYVSGIVVNANQIELEFSEPLDEAIVESATNYELLTLGFSSVAELTSGTTVLLTFPFDFPENEEMTLEISNLTDVWGNSAGVITQTFTYFVFGEPSFRDLVFNEVLADPTPAIGLPEYEFVEIYNQSDEVFNLNDWEFVNSTTSKILPNFNLEPGAYVILCDDEASAEFEGFGDVISISSFTALSNAGDSLTLLDSGGNVIDMLVYDIDWYATASLANGGVSLEQINPLANCSGAANWSESSNLTGGSPGSVNSVWDTSPDITPPSFISHEVITSNQIEVTLDEPLVNLVNITVNVNPTLTLGPIEQGSNTSSILLNLVDPLQLDETYIFEIDGIEDCEGNVISNLITFEVVVGGIPEIGDIIFTEILADPSDEESSPNSEFVEIYNASDQLLEITDLSISGGTFTEQVLIAPGEYIIVANITNNIDFLVFPGTKFMESFPGLTNGGRSIELTDSEGNIFDEVTYDLSWYGVGNPEGEGYSLELINLDDPCSDGDNWTASTSSQGATPAAVNSVFDDTPDTISPEILSVVVTGPDKIEVTFDEQLDADAEILMTSEIYQRIGSTDQELEYLQLAVGFVDESHRVLEITYDGAFAPTIDYRIRTYDAEDCWGNSNSGTEYSEGKFAVPEDYEIGDLVINEILSNPTTEGSDFIEIHNVSEKNISLLGMALANRDGGELDGVNLLVNEPTIIFSGDHLVFTENRNAVLSEYPLSTSINIIEVEDLATYNNDEGSVVLLDSLSLELDEVRYDVEMHFPLLQTTDGVSLEKVNPLASGMERTNWHSASEQVGFATPGYRNSQFLMDVEGSLGELELSPRVFSPDNDGFEDVLSISFLLQDVGFVGNITIFDDHGRFIDQIMNNALLGTEGEIFWHGLDAQGQKAPIGAYVIYFEGFHPDGRTFQLTKTCALGHKLN